MCDDPSNAIIRIASFPLPYIPAASSLISRLQPQTPQHSNLTMQEWQAQMIDPNASPIAHRPVYKRIDINHIGRRRVITRQEVLDNICREPDAEVYEYNQFFDSWTLKEGK